MSLHKEEDLKIQFDGSRGGRFALTRGQLDVYRSLGAYAPALGVFNIRGTVPVPPGTGVDQVCDVLRWAVERYEALRTTYPSDPAGGPFQFVRRTGEINVGVYELHGDEQASEVIPPGFGQDFDHASEVPLRITLLTWVGEPVRVALEISHLSLDLVGWRILERAVARRLAGQSTAGPDRVYQPADRAGDEDSAAGRAANERAVSYSDRILSGHRTPLFEPLGNYPGDTPRCPRARIGSHALGVAVGLISGRHRVTASTVHLTSMAVLMAAWSGAERFAFSVTSSNRWLPGGSDYVGTLNQFALASIDLTGADLPELLERMQRAGLEAHAHASYNIDDLAALGHADGVGSVDCVFNTFQRTDRRLPAADLDPERLRDLLPRTVVEEVAPFPATARRRSLHLLVSGPTDRPELWLCTDRHVLPEVDPAAALRTLESVFVDFARDPGPYLGVPVAAALAEAAARCGTSALFGTG